MVDPGEQCDDGNTTPSDGCSDTCQHECISENLECELESIVLVGDTPTVARARITNNNNAECTPFVVVGVGFEPPDIVVTDPVTSISDTIPPGEFWQFDVTVQMQPNSDAKGMKELWYLNDGYGTFCYASAEMWIIPESETSEEFVILNNEPFDAFRGRLSAPGSPDFGTRSIKEQVDPVSDSCWYPDSPYEKGSVSAKDLGSWVVNDVLPLYKNSYGIDKLGWFPDPLNWYRGDQSRYTCAQIEWVLSGAYDPPPPLTTECASQLGQRLAINSGEVNGGWTEYQEQDVILTIQPASVVNQRHNLALTSPYLAPVQADSDGDVWPDLCDNCPHDANQGQEDTDGDGMGDACDP